MTTAITSTTHAQALQRAATAEFDQLRDHHRAIGQRLTSHQEHTFWATKKALGLNPLDQFQYVEGELEGIREEYRAMWFTEACTRAGIDGLPAEYQQAATHRIARYANKLDKSALDALISTIRTSLDAAPLAIDADYSELREWASARAAHMGELLVKFKQHQDAGHLDEAMAIARIALEHVTGKTGFVPPKGTTPDSFFLRVVQSKFWARSAKKRMTRAAIQLARDLQMLGTGRTKYDPAKARAQYLPHDVVGRAHSQIEMTRDWLASTVIVDSDGHRRTLAEITEGAPARQMALLELRAIAQMELAEERGLQAYLVTITVPSRFHPTTTIKNGNKRWSVQNKNYAHLSAQTACDWKTLHWSKLRARLAKAHLDYEVIGALEGTRDATPHWHLLFYIADENEAAARGLFRDVFLYEREGHTRLSDGDLESGADEHRVDFDKVRSQAGARAYVTKILRYVLKTVHADANENEDDGEEKPPKPTAEALYARSIGRRAFAIKQQNIQIWNWLRSVRDPDSLPDELRADWHNAHGYDPATEAIPYLPRTRLGQPDMSDPRRIEDRSCHVPHMVSFLKGTARHYQPAFFLGDYYEIKFKTITDYADSETGEIGLESYENFYADQQAWEDDSIPLEQQPSIRTIARKLNSFGEPKKPTKFPAIVHLDDDGNCLGIAFNRYQKCWEKDAVASAELKVKRVRDKKKKKAEAEAKAKAKATGDVLKKIASDAANAAQAASAVADKTEELQLLIRSQGAPSGAAFSPQPLGFIASLQARNDAHNAAFRLMNADELRSRWEGAKEPQYRDPGRPNLGGFSIH